MTIHQDILPTVFFEYARASQRKSYQPRTRQQHRWNFYKIVRIYAKRFDNWPPKELWSALWDKATDVSELREL